MSQPPTCSTPDPADVEAADVEAGALDDATLVRAYRALVVGRRFDQQATSLAKQGYLTVYPSSFGQEACQVAAGLVLQPQDWLLPTYRDSVAIMTRGIDPAQTVTLFRGDWHCGWDAAATRTFPHATPLATQAAHGVGLAMAARLRGDDAVALVLSGDGATSEGDFHEALNLAAVFDAPVVFLVQNNGYAISVPTHRQTRAARIADKALGYGMHGERVDGNDPVAVLDALRRAVAKARDGGGPSLVEAVTYRLGPHTNADDPTRYREAAEAQPWLERDPVTSLAATLRERGLLDDAGQAALDAEAAEIAGSMRTRLLQQREASVADLFEHVYAVPPAHLRAQAEQVAVLTGEPA